VLDGVVFLVGLDGHRLLAEFREAALVDGDVLFNGAARVLVVGERRFRRRDVLPRRLEPGVERLLAVRLLAQPPLRVEGGRIEALERDQFLEVSIHQ